LNEGEKVSQSQSGNGKYSQRMTARRLKKEGKPEVEGRERRRGKGSEHRAFLFSLLLSLLLH
jgi:hypothetical protein